MIKSDASVLFRSSNDEWETPQTVFDTLNAEFHFNLDPCATDENHKCQKYYTMLEDGLLRDWGGAHSFLQSSVQQDCSVG